MKSRPPVWLRLGTPGVLAWVLGCQSATPAQDDVAASAPNAVSEPSSQEARARREQPAFQHGSNEQSPPRASTSTNSSAVEQRRVEASGARAFTSGDPPLPFVHLTTGGAAPDGALPWIIGLHGLGDRPEAFSRLFAEAPFQAHVYVPQAILPRGKGFDWFGVRVSGDQEQLAQAMGRAMQPLLRLIDFLQHDAKNLGKPVVTGFSQGGMLSFALAVEHPTSIRASFPIGGWLPERLWPEQKAEGAVAIVAFHGEADRVVPFEPTHELTDHLRRQDWEIRLHSYPDLGHSIHGGLRNEWYGGLSAALSSDR